LTDLFEELHLLHVKVSKYVLKNETFPIEKLQIFYYPWLLINRVDKVAGRKFRYGKVLSSVNLFK
jgi:hypothetical protein